MNNLDKNQQTDQDQKGKQGEQEEEDRPVYQDIGNEGMKDTKKEQPEANQDQG